MSEAVDNRADLPHEDNDLDARLQELRPVLDLLDEVWPRETARAEPVSTPSGDEVSGGATLGSTGEIYDQFRARLGGEDTALDASFPTIEGYTIERSLGQGGMGQVFLARNHELNRVEAIKVLQPRGAAAERRRLAKRFLREARMLANLKHDHIVSVYQGRPRDDAPYFAMEYLRRGSLAQEDERRRLVAGGAPAIVEFMIKVARAVDYAHGQRVLHRDLKPGNILVDERGEPMVSDFGLAKLLDPTSEADAAAEPGSDPPTGDSGGGLGDTVTQSVSLPGRQPGTPPYMAPEQHDTTRGPVTSATDVWALGVILHELLFGQRPFVGQGPELRDNILNAAVVLPKQAPPGVDARLGQIVLRCLCKEPKERFASAGELAAALAKWEHDRRQSARGPLRRYAAAGLVAAGLLIAILLLTRRQPDPEVLWQTLWAQLVEQRTATLIPEKGSPAYTRWVLNNQAHAGVDRKGFFYVSADLGVLELVREVPMDSYRIRAKICQTKGDQQARVGIFFGGREYTDEKTTAFACLRFDYNDTFDERAHIIRESTLKGKPFDPKRDNPANVSNLIEGIFDDGTAWSSRPGGTIVTFFKPAGFKGGVWRSVVIDVRPGRVTASLDGSVPKDIDMTRFKLTPQPAADARFAILNTITSAYAPRGSVGLFVDRGIASCSDVVIEPLPD